MRAGGRRSPAYPGRRPAPRPRPPPGQGIRDSPADGRAPQALGIRRDGDPVQAPGAASRPGTSTCRTASIRPSWARRTTVPSPGWRRTGRSPPARVVLLVPWADHLRHRRGQVDGNGKHGVADPAHAHAEDVAVVHQGQGHHGVALGISDVDDGVGTPVEGHPGAGGHRAVGGDQAGRDLLQGLDGAVRGQPVHPLLGGEPARCPRGRAVATAGTRPPSAVRRGAEEGVGYPGGVHPPGTACSGARFVASPAEPPPAIALGAPARGSPSGSQIESVPAPAEPRGALGSHSRPKALLIEIPRGCPTGGSGAVTACGLLCPFRKAGLWAQKSCAALQGGAPGRRWRRTWPGRRADRRPRSPGRGRSPPASPGSPAGPRTGTRCRPAPAARPGSSRLGVGGEGGAVPGSAPRGGRRPPG